MKCRGLLLARCKGSSCDQSPLPDHERAHTNIQNRHLALFLVAMPALLALCGFAQQGWSTTQPIMRNGIPATINSVYFDGDDVWVVGAKGLISRSFDDGRTFQDIDTGVQVGLNDVFARNKRVWVV